MKIEIKKEYLLTIDRKELEALVAVFEVACGGLEWNEADENQRNCLKMYDEIIDFHRIETGE